MTKRQILSLVSSIYDPLGMVAPFVLQAKIFLQDLCRQRVWDDEIPEKELVQFRKWQEDLRNLESLALHRFYRSIAASLMEIQVHIFGDASNFSLPIEHSETRASSCSYVHSFTRQ